MLRWSRIACASVPFLVACSVAEPPQVTCVVVGSGGAVGNGGNGGGGSGNTPGGGTGGAPLPAGEWVNVTNELAGLESTCGNAYTVSAKPDEDVLFAGITNRGIWKSTDGGNHWAQTEQQAAILGGPNSYVYDPAHPQTFWISSIYAFAQSDKAPIAYRTDDGGETFILLGQTGHNDLVSVDFSDPERKTLVAGAHEEGHKAWRSHDSGQTWTQFGAGLPAKSGWSVNPLVIDSTTFLMGTPQTGIYRTTDDTKTWTQVSEKGGGTFPLVASNGAIYWQTADSSTVVKSTDDGETWTEVEASAELIVAPMLELPDGRIVAMGKQSLLALSADEKSWKPLTAQIPSIKVGDASFVPRGMTYSSQQKAFFIWFSTCEKIVADDAIRRFDFDYEAD